MTSLPIITIVGQPNVGKSTLFNRLAGKRQAIIQNLPGVTRDRLYAHCCWQGKDFLVVDTGGMTFSPHETIFALMGAQTQIAIKEASVVLYLLDGRQPPSPEDKQIIKTLRQSGKPLVFALNKLDHSRHESNCYEFFALGITNFFPISAEHGIGIGDLLTELATYLPQPPEEAPAVEEEPAVEAIKVAVVGRPNVGKSSLLNVILGEDRVLVAETPGTTRDTIDTPFQFGEQPFILIDTAGIRKQKKLKEPLEKICVIKAFQAISRSHVVLLLIDATLGVTEQDAKIAGYAQEQKKACIIVINKWDLMDKKGSYKDYFADIRQRLKFLHYSPMLTTSAYKKWGTIRLLKDIEAVWATYCKRIPTPILNKLFAQAIKRKQPSFSHRTKFLYLTQVGIKPPTFVLFTNRKDKLHFSYIRYLHNQLRQLFDLQGTPLKLIMRARRRK